LSARHRSPPGLVSSFQSNTPLESMGGDHISGSPRHGSRGLEISPKGGWTFMGAQRVPETPQEINAPDMGCGPSDRPDPALAHKRADGRESEAPRPRPRTSQRRRAPKKAPPRRNPSPPTRPSGGTARLPTHHTTTNPEAASGSKGPFRSQSYP